MAFIWELQDQGHDWLKKDEKKHLDESRDFGNILRFGEKKGKFLKVCIPI